MTLGVLVRTISGYSCLKRETPPFYGGAYLFVIDR
jgi:hypothetical protein